MTKEVVIDDSEEFVIFELFDKFEKHPEELTPIERLALRELGARI